MLVSRTHRTLESTLLVRHRCPSVGCTTSKCFVPAVPRSQCRPKSKAPCKPQLSWHAARQGRAKGGVGQDVSKRGGSPSTLAVAVSGKARRLAAKARAAANDKWEDHRQTKAATAGPRDRIVPVSGMLPPPCRSPAFCNRIHVGNHALQCSTPCMGLRLQRKMYDTGGHHCLHDGRAARHRDRNTACARCCFCATGVDSLKHALLHCTAHSIPGQMWASRSRHSSRISLHMLFCTDLDVNSARDICSNTQYASSICAAAEACVT